MLNAVVSLGWDLKNRPFEKTLLNVQAFVFDAAKIAACLGYMIPVAADVSKDTTKRFCVYVIVVLVPSLVGGFVLAGIQVVRNITELFRRQSDAVVPAKVTQTSTSTRTLRDNVTEVTPQTGPMK